MTRWEHHLDSMTARHSTGRAGEVVSSVRTVWQRLREAAPDLPPPDQSGPMVDGLADGYEMAWEDLDQRIALDLEISRWACEWYYREDGVLCAGTRFGCGAGLWPISEPLPAELAECVQRMLRRRER